MTRPLPGHLLRLVNKGEVAPANEVPNINFGAPAYEAAPPIREIVGQVLSSVYAMGGYEHPSELTAAIGSWAVENFGPERAALFGRAVAQACGVRT